MDLITGYHSIACAIENPERTGLDLYVTDEAFNELRKKHPFPKGWQERVELRKLKPHDLQERAKAFHNELDFHFQRASGGAFLTADSLEEKGLNELYDYVEGHNRRILFLDGVTDVHNMGAIFRSADFYDVHAVVVSRKGGVRLPPGFFKIASGAAEHINLVNVSSLSKAIKSLMDRGIKCIGLSEHESPITDIRVDGSVALILGAEETGISNAVKRLLTDCYALKAQGQTKSLNVSVAAAVAMEKFWGID